MYEEKEKPKFLKDELTKFLNAARLAAKAKDVQMILWALKNAERVLNSDPTINANTTNLGSSILSANKLTIRSRTIFFIYIIIQTNCLAILKRCHRFLLWKIGKKRLDFSFVMRLVLIGYLVQYIQRYSRRRLIDLAHVE